MKIDSEKVKLYLHLKLGVIFITFCLITIEQTKSLIGPVAAGASYFALLTSFLTIVFLWGALKKQSLSAFFVFLSLFFDLLVVVAALYFAGGVENTWYFLPLLLIYLAGYLFDIKTSFFFAFASFILVSASFGLEYFGIVPHFTVYDLPESYWKLPERFFDYLVGLFLIYFLGAFSSGFSNHYMRQAAQRLKKSLDEVKEAQRESENARRALMNVMEDIEMVSRMKSDFISIVSHELGTPLTAIKSGIELIKGSGGLDGEHRDFLDIVMRNVSRLQRLISNVLIFSRLEEKKTEFSFKKANIAQAACETAEAYKRQAALKGLALECRCAKNLLEVMFDPDRITQVIGNLVNNAIKFTDKGGVIVTVENSKRGVVVAVEDTGGGIAKSDIPKLFHKFERLGKPTERKSEGAGLGLVICKGIVSGHKGEIGVESELGKGSRFWFSLPA